MPAVKPGTNTSFGPLKQIDAGVLNVGYAEAGPADGPPVILLHGWPYDIHSFVDVAPLLASAGYRVIVPYLRGYGTTRFLSSETAPQRPAIGARRRYHRLDGCSQDREGDPCRLRLGRADRQHRRGALARARARPWSSVSGYLIGNQEAGKMPLPPKAELEWWYQFYFATERGRAGYEKYRRDFSKLIWQLASPKWEFDDATFDRSAAAFDNPDHVAIVIHNYRWRLGLAEGEPKYDELEKRLAEGPVITVPTITLEGDANGAPHPDPSAYAKKFSGKYEHRLIKGGIGHNLPQEAPQAFAQAVIDVAASLIDVSPRSRPDEECSMTQVANEHTMHGAGKVLYTAKTHTTGGRDGASRSSDGRLDVKLSSPGTAGIGTNPEQLFAAGWSACFDQRDRACGRQEEDRPPGRPGHRRRGGPQHCGTAATSSSARLNVSLPGLERDVAQALVDAAHQTARTPRPRAATSTSRSTWSELTRSRSHREGERRRNPKAAHIALQGWLRTSSSIGARRIAEC